MRNFAIATLILGLAMSLWTKASVVNTKADIVRPKVELSSPASNPYLPVQVLDPAY